MTAPYATSRPTVRRLPSARSAASSRSSLVPWRGSRIRRTSTSLRPRRRASSLFVTPLSHRARMTASFAASWAGDAPGQDLRKIPLARSSPFLAGVREIGTSRVLALVDICYHAFNHIWHSRKWNYRCTNLQQIQVSGRPLLNVIIYYPLDKQGILH
jgi:hypothetical protein